MAIQVNETFETESHPIPDGTHCTLSRSVTLATGSGDLPRNCPVAYNTSTNLWVPLTHSGANGTDVVKGFVWPEAITLSGSGEVLGTIMFEGEINYGDVNTAAILAATGKNAAQLETSLQSGVRELGINVTGISNFR